MMLWRPITVPVWDDCPSGDRPLLSKVDGLYCTIKQDGNSLSCQAVRPILPVWTDPSITKQKISPSLMYDVLQRVPYVSKMVPNPRTCSQYADFGCLVYVNTMENNDPHANDFAKRQETGAFHTFDVFETAPSKMVTKFWVAMNVAGKVVQW